MRAGLLALLVIVVAGAFAALNALFIVNPTQQALVLQFGQVTQAIRDPGLNTKIPFIQQVIYLDKRNLDLDVPAQEIIAADQKRLVVDAFMRWRIADPVLFYQTVATVPQGEDRLSGFVASAVRTVLADATFTDIVRDNRSAIMQRIGERVAGLARGIGVEVVDVKIRRADLPDANSAAIFERMQTERQQEAREIRAEGEEAALRVRAAAERTATVLRAEAQREADQIRGQGDAQRSAIFARAYALDPDFFGFYRAMQAYQKGLGAQDTRLVLSPDTDFFRYFNDPFGRAQGGRTRPATAPGEGAQGSVSSLPSGAAGAPAAGAGAPGASAEESAVESSLRDAIAPVDSSAGGAAAGAATPAADAAADAAAVPDVAPDEVRPIGEGEVTIVAPEGEAAAPADAAPADAAPAATPGDTGAAPADATPAPADATEGAATAEPEGEARPAQ